MRLFKGVVLTIAAGLLFGCGNRPLAPVGTLEGTPDAKQSPVKRTNTSKARNKKLASRIHIVKPGDTLYSIGWEHGQDYKKIAAYNGIKPPYTIHVGQRLQLAPNNAEHSRQATNTTQPDQKAVQVKPLATRINWHWPTRGKILELYSSKEPGNKGIDIAGKAGQAIYAAATGKVVYAGSGLPRYGNLLIIKHSDIYLSAYAHNQTLLVKEGQHVKAKQKIALLGNTGTQRYKLHFEIRYDGRPINPLPLLPKVHQQ